MLLITAGEGEVSPRGISGVSNERAMLVKLRA